MGGKRHQLLHGAGGGNRQSAGGPHDGDHAGKLLGALSAQAYIPNREEQRLIWQHHADVYEALQARSPERARAAIIAHMDFIEAKLTESLQAFDEGET